MNDRSPFADNTILWSCYFDEQRREWLRVLGVPQDSALGQTTRAWADTAAATAAYAGGILVAPVINLLFRQNVLTVREPSGEAPTRTSDSVPEYLRAGQRLHMEPWQPVESGQSAVSGKR